MTETLISTEDLEVGQAKRVNNGEIIAKFAAEHAEAVLTMSYAMGTVHYADEYVFIVEASDGSVGAFALSPEGDWWEARMNIKEDEARDAILDLATAMTALKGFSLPE